MALLLLLGLVQGSDVDALLAKLGDDDPAVRDGAVKELSRLGPEATLPLLSLHRRSESVEIRARVEGLLLKRPLAAFLACREGDPVRETLKRALLKDVEEHRAIPGCAEADGGTPPQRILRQTGSGHGQFLAIEEIRFVEGGGATLRRVAFQGTTPYRPAVKEEGVRVETAELDAAEAAALSELLRAGTCLRVPCAKPKPVGRAWSSSGSFSMRFRIEFARKAPWSVAYTGYPGTLGEPAYAHGRILEDFLRRAAEGREGKPSELTGTDRALVLRWAADAWSEEEGWVREHYLDFARHLGDDGWLPFLEAAEKSLAGEEGPSIDRQREAIADARRRIAARR